MANRIKWRLKGFQEIRRMPELNHLIEGIVDDIVQALGPGYEGDVRAGRTRTRGSVVTAEAAAIIDNSTNNSLLRELARQRVGV